MPFYHINSKSVNYDGSSSNNNKKNIQTAQLLSLNSDAAWARSKRNMETQKGILCESNKSIIRRQR